MEKFFYEFNNAKLNKVEIKNETSSSLNNLKENIQGKTLKELINKREFSIDDIFSITNKLLEILDDMRSVFPPILHKNINLSNIIIKDDLDIALIGFNSQNKNHKFYMAPESLDYPTPKSDLYSVGIVLISILLKNDLENIKDYDNENILNSIDFDKNFINFIKLMTAHNSDNRFKDIKTAKAKLLKIKDGSITDSDWDTQKANNANLKTLEHEDILHNEFNEVLNHLDEPRLRKYNKGLSNTSSRAQMNIIFIIIIILIIFIVISR